jgi:hypothetical protein
MSGKKTDRTSELECGNIVLHSPGGDHICFGPGTLIKKRPPQIWEVKFFDGREFEMVHWSLKKITDPLTK